ncbi:MAG: hypothetical protein ACOYLX_09815 [Burkholderiaceae bacterium]
MPTPNPLRRRTLRAAAAMSALGGSALAAGCANPAAVPAPPGTEPIAPPLLRVGDQWRYRLTNRYNRSTIGETTVQVLAASPEIRLRLDPGGGAAPFEERYADAWSVLVDASFDAPMVFESAVPLVPAGLRASSGRRTTTRYRSERASQPLAWEQRLDAIGWERVQVPAGTFDALRIERNIRLEHPDFFKLGGERNETLWYAPQVGRWIAREWTGSYMPGSPTPRSGRAREDWVRWELTAWQPAAR